MKKLLTFLSLVIAFTACETTKDINDATRVVKYSIKLTYDKTIFSNKDCQTLAGNIYLTNSTTLIDGGIKEDINQYEMKVTGEYDSETTEINADIQHLFIAEDGNKSFEKVGYITGYLYRDYGEGSWAIAYEGDELKSCEGTWEAVRNME